MANVTRYDPFGELFDDFFKGYFVRPVGGDSRTTAPRLTVDVTEQNGAFKVLAEIPGVKKDDIRVTIDGDQVTIGGRDEAGEGRQRRRAAGAQRALLRQGLPVVPSRLRN